MNDDGKMLIRKTEVIRLSVMMKETPLIKMVLVLTLQGVDLNTKPFRQSY